MLRILLFINFYLLIKSTLDRYNAIIFDLGKVVFDLSFDRTFKFWATASGRQFDDIKSKFRFDELSDEFERGDISASQFRAEVSQRLDIRLSDEDFDTGRWVLSRAK